MALFDFTCIQCGATEEVICRSQERDDPRKCEQCGGPLQREFPITAALGFQPFESYYDPGLGCDITSKREKQRVMRALGVTEAGDTVKGSRNFDAKAPDHLKPLPPKGVPFVSPQQREALERVDWQVAAEKKGEVIPLDVAKAKDP